MLVGILREIALDIIAHTAVNVDPSQLTGDVPGVLFALFRRLIEGLIVIEVGEGFSEIAERAVAENRLARRAAYRHLAQLVLVSGGKGNVFFCPCLSLLVIFNRQTVGLLSNTHTVERYVSLHRRQIASPGFEIIPFHVILNPSPSNLICYVEILTIA